jgi:hypothetical protein
VVFKGISEVVLKGVHAVVLKGMREMVSDVLFLREVTVDSEQSRNQTKANEESRPAKSRTSDSHKLVCISGVRITVRFGLAMCLLLIYESIILCVVAYSLC